MCRTLHALSWFGFVALSASCVIDAPAGGEPLDVVFSDASDELESADAGQVCAPHEARCPALLESQVCSWDGRSWGTVACKSGEVCVADMGGCVPVMCDPFTSECTGDQSLKTCSAEGLAWETTSCDSDHYCVSGYCVYGRCLGHVLLLIDRSSSMKPHWQTVKQSVLKLVSAHPTTRFGLMSFPGDEKCTVPYGPAIPLTAFGKADLFTAYFDTYHPTLSTPLLAGLKQVRERHQEIFQGQSGVVVVISDGEDTCEKNKKLLEEQLQVEAQALSAAGVRIYVIGYNYQGDATQLDAIAKHGNTERESYVPAGNESELDEAFKGIVSDIKLCL